MADQVLILLYTYQVLERNGIQWEVIQGSNSAVDRLKEYL